MSGLTQFNIPRYNQVYELLKPIEIRWYRDSYSRAHRQAAIRFYQYPNEFDGWITISITVPTKPDNNNVLYIPIPVPAGSRFTVSRMLPMRYQGNQHFASLNFATKLNKLTPFSAMHRLGLRAELSFKELHEVSCVEV